MKDISLTPYARTVIKVEAGPSAPINLDTPESDSTQANIRFPYFISCILLELDVFI